MDVPWFCGRVPFSEFRISPFEIRSSPAVFTTPLQHLDVSQNVITASQNLTTPKGMDSMIIPSWGISCLVDADLASSKAPNCY